MRTLEFRVKDIHENTFDVHEIPVSPTVIGLAVEEAQFVKPINGIIQLARRVNEVYVKADIAASIEIVCRRCTLRFGADIEAKIELQFYPAEKSEHVESFLLMSVSGIMLVNLLIYLMKCGKLFCSKFLLGRYVRSHAKVCVHAAGRISIQHLATVMILKGSHRHLQLWEIF